MHKQHEEKKERGGEEGSGSALENCLRIIADKLPDNENFEHFEEGFKVGMDLNEYQIQVHLAGIVAGMAHLRTCEPHPSLFNDETCFREVVEEARSNLKYHPPKGGNHE